MAAPRRVLVTFYVIRKLIISRLALKIVVMTREQGTGFGQLYFSLHITLREAASRLRFFSVHLLSAFQGTLAMRLGIDSQAFFC